MNRGGALTALAAVVADTAAILLSFWLLPWFADRFRSPSPSNALVVAGMYLVFCLAIYRLRRTGAISAAVGTGASVTAVLLGVVVAYMAAFSSGFSVSSLLDLDLGSLMGSLLAIAALIVALLLVFLYMLVLVLPVPDSDTAARSAPLVRRLFLLLGANLMPIVSTAFWAAHLAGPIFGADLAAGARGLLFVAASTLLAAMFGGPRHLLSRSGAGPVPVVTFLLQAAYYAWAFISGSAL